MEEILLFCIEEGHDVLVMSDASKHKIDIVKDTIEEFKTKKSIIPGGYTRYLQPLDVFINKPFKDELKKRFTKYCTDQKILRQG